MEEYDLTGTLTDGAVAFKVESPKHPAGERYVFRSPSGEVGLWLKNLIEFGQQAQLGFEVGEDTIGKLVLNDDEETDLYRRVMGDTLQLMLDDGVLWEPIQTIFTALLRKWGMNTRISDTLDELRGEAPGPANRATKRAAKKAPKKAPKQVPRKRSSPKAGSKSSPASSGTSGRTTARASTPSSKTSEERQDAATG